ncbi:MULTISPECIES: hypothetical protein [unclassified Paraburkholderia]|uniref:hypothetical protein n=1 Tax=unclassified Paraburkholderia TaxID=2615204 RepID=UPI0016162BB7|nr:MULTISPECIES: hypothetical protein [unclassified Paraburkholderia]MBB5448215.1 hypothetical protein [Paraburkholderia sp. WSM4177]MBB5488610.1 hypothetical protein [Paraburkholderia sp. WSM4180]
MATKPPVVHDGSHHKPLAAGDTLAYAPQLDAYTGEVVAVPYSQADFGVTKGLLINIPHGPVDHAHFFLGTLLIVATEKVALNWHRTIYFTVSGRIGKLNPFDLVGMPLSITGGYSETGDTVAPFTLPVYAKLPAGNGDTSISVGYRIAGHHTIEPGAEFRYQLLGNHIY